MTSLSFPDVNVWLAVISPDHVHRAAARRWWDSDASAVIAISRFAQIGVLRLLTTAAVMNVGLEGSGTLHTLAMTTADAMWLLKNLQYMQARFDLPIPDGPVVDATPGKTELAGLLTPRAPQVRVRAR